MHFSPIQPTPFPMKASYCLHSIIAEMTLPPLVFPSCIKKSGNCMSRPGVFFCPETAGFQLCSSLEERHGSYNADFPLNLSHRCQQDLGLNATYTPLQLRLVRRAVFISFLALHLTAINEMYHQSIAGLLCKYSYPSNALFDHLPSLPCWTPSSTSRK